ncbi:WD40 repeat domain-containing protein [Acanthopleuribacter pedis]|uniref:WD40 repeat domain-containing protein n=1 Tax=Acanthopleuribacter pedis TaxID=442870 RepID=A0A8J7Q5W6_9BACT|nr:hypothetical protein [Acanthopleuribacter pedis]MBO1321052.1 hypothetical protein [Acanthopleuribacter pedis]
MGMMLGLFAAVIQSAWMGSAPVQEPRYSWRQAPPALERRLSQGVLQWQVEDKTLIFTAFDKSRAVEKARLETDLPAWPVVDWMRHGQNLFVVQQNAAAPGEISLARLNLSKPGSLFQWRLSHPEPVMRATLNHHRRRLLTLDEKGAVRLWRVELDPYQERPTMSQKAVLLKEHHFNVQKGAAFVPSWSPLGNFYTMPRHGGGLLLYDGQDGVVLGDFGGVPRDAVYRGDNPPIQALAFSQREERIAVLRYSAPGVQSPASDLVVWDNWGLNQGRLMRVDADRIRAMDFDRMEDQLVLASGDRLMVWDAVANQVRKEWPAGVVDLLRCHPRRSWIAAKNRAGELTLYEMNTGQTLATFAGADAHGTRLEFSYDGRLLLLLGRTQSEPFIQAWVVPPIP